MLREEHNMKKRIGIIILSVLFVSAAITGCGNTKEGSAEKEKKEAVADEKFLKDLAKGLEARWSIKDQDVELGSEEEKKYTDKLVSAELDILEKYQNEKFEDSKLQEKAIQYINLLKQQKEALDYMTADYEKYGELWTEAYDKRTQMIVDFVNDYKLTVSDKYESTLKDITVNAKQVTEENEKEEKVQALVESIEFGLAEDDGYGWKTYNAVVENTTEMTFSYFNLTINLLDQDDVIVETTYANVSNWGKGQKVKFEFMTDKEFAATQVGAEYSE